MFDASFRTLLDLPDCLLPRPSERRANDSLTALDAVLSAAEGDVDLDSLHELIVAASNTKNSAVVARLAEARALHERCERRRDTGRLLAAAVEAANLAELQRLIPIAAGLKIDTANAQLVRQLLQATESRDAESLLLSCSRAKGASSVPPSIITLAEAALTAALQKCDEAEKQKIAAELNSAIDAGNEAEIARMFMLAEQKAVDTRAASKRLAVVRAEKEVMQSLADTDLIRVQAAIAQALKAGVSIGPIMRANAHHARLQKLASANRSAAVKSALEARNIEELLKIAVECEQQEDPGVAQEVKGAIAFVHAEDEARRNLLPFCSQKVPNPSALGAALSAARAFPALASIVYEFEEKRRLGSLKRLELEAARKEILRNRLEAAEAARDLRLLQLVIDDAAGTGLDLSHATALAAALRLEAGLEECISRVHDSLAGGFDDEKVAADVSALKLALRRARTNLSIVTNTALIIRATEQIDAGSSRLKRGDAPHEARSDVAVASANVKSAEGMVPRHLPKGPNGTSGFESRPQVKRELFIPDVLAADHGDYLQDLAEPTVACPTSRKVGRPVVTFTPFQLSAKTKQLAQEMAKCSSAHALHNFVRQHASQIMMYHLSKALTSLHAMDEAADGSSSAWKECEAHLLLLASDRIDGADAGSLAIVLSSLARSSCATSQLSLPVTNALTKLLHAESRTDARGLTAPNVSKCMWALAKLGCNDWTLFEALACCARGLLDQYSHQDISDTLWACAKLGWLEPNFVTALAHRLVACVELPSRSLATSFWAMAHLDFFPGSTFEMLTSRIATAYEIFSLPELLSVLRSCAKVGSRPEQLIPVFLQRIDPVSPTLPVRDLCEISWSLSRLGVADAKLHKCISARVLACCDTILPSQFATWLWSIDALSTRVEIDAVLASRLCSIILSRADEFSLRDLVVVLCTAVNLKIADRLLDVLVPLLASQLCKSSPSVEPLDSSTVVHEDADSQDIDNVHFVVDQLHAKQATVARKTVGIHSRLLENRDLANIMWSFVKMGQLPPPLLSQAVVYHMRKRLTKFSSFELSVLCSLLAELGMLSDDLRQVTARHIHASLASLDVDNLVNVMRVFHSDDEESRSLVAAAAARLSHQFSELPAKVRVDLFVHTATYDRKLLPERWSSGLGSSICAVLPLVPTGELPRLAAAAADVGWRSDSFASHLVTALSPIAPTMSCADLAHLARSVALLEMESLHSLFRLAMDCLQQLPAIEASHACNIMWACAKHEYRRLPLLRKCTAVVRSNLANFSDIELVEMLCSWARLQYSPDVDTWQAWEAHMQHRLLSLPTDVVSQAIRSLVALKRSPSSFLRAFVERARASSSMLPAQSLLQLFLCLAGAVEADGDWTVIDEIPVNFVFLAQSSCLCLVDTATPSDLVLLLSALATIMGRKVQCSISQERAEAVPCTPGGTHPTDTRSILCSLSSCHDELFESAVPRLLREMQRLEPEELGLILDAYANVNVYSVSLCDGLVNVTPPPLRRFS